MDTSAQTLLDLAVSKLKALSKWSYWTIREVLDRDGSWILLGNGVSRIVYAHADFPAFVVKIQTNKIDTSSTYCHDYANYSEYTMYHKHIPDSFKGYFATPYVASRDFQILIAEKIDSDAGWYADTTCEADEVFGLINEEIRDQGVRLGYDLHNGNVRVGNGTFKVIDFGGAYFDETPEIDPNKTKMDITTKRANRVYTHLYFREGVQPVQSDPTTYYSPTYFETDYYDHQDVSFAMYDYDDLF